MFHIHTYIAARWWCWWTRRRARAACARACGAPTPTRRDTSTPCCRTSSCTGWLVSYVSHTYIHSGSLVVLVDAAPCAGGVRACVRRADSDAQRHFDAVLQDVVMYGVAATPLKEPPLQGQTVVGKFSDGLHYRALCRRTNIKQNKYQLEYIEYGNIEVSKLEMLYPCPQEYDVGQVPTVVSVVTLDVGAELTAAALEYLEQLKEQEMMLTLPDGAKTAPSGSAAILTVIKTNENMQKKLVELSTPDWKKIEERGGDVVETQCLMYSDMECLQLPSTGGMLQVLDVSLLADGSVSACQEGLAHAQYVFTHLASMMAEYCNSELGRQPYLPKVEELCIAKCPPNSKWYRAVFLEQLDGPGGGKARILYVDTGYLGVVPVELLRKMLPEFVKGLPALACHLEIKDFPSRPTPDMLAKARQHMRVDEQGRGQLRVTKCTKLDDGMYSVEAKELIQAMMGWE
ncbi:uncharacterized protein LOC115453403 isoform X2 [Manduca sexta]|uniref:uncharacterized protein LOC115453403 isoform X1 n=1 Tax=Manduca sexta TaxID=7130 RepID=UPI0018906A8A|nr:uncharacterized protein LOC115453403 isoform X1 [Manduca sexta]XP_037299900.1 uncharacterized protein LOC115453403 isoform X2 [Manduca sexta]